MTKSCMVLPAIFGSSAWEVASSYLSDARNFEATARFSYICAPLSLGTGKGKGKANPRTGHEGTEGE
jgi:hypothetical protein